MRSHRRTIRRIRRLAIVLVGVAALVPAGAAASLSAKQYSDAYGAALNGPTKVGDTPADFPGASRYPNVASPTVEIVRPERTVVRNVNEALPIALSGAALLIVMTGGALVLVRVRMERRQLVGRSH